MSTKTPISKYPVLPILFRHAVASDVEAIAALVNSAYRGKSSRAGWTTEADILGGQRTDAEEITSLIRINGSVILLCTFNEEIIGSVHLRKVDDMTAYLGMLVINPRLQAKGIGSRLMNEAEKIVRTEWGLSRVQMEVISLRDELISYYLRRGYRRTGEIRPFPATDAKFGIPKVEGLMFEVLEKFLGDATN